MPNVPIQCLAPRKTYTKNKSVCSWYLTWVETMQYKSIDTATNHIMHPSSQKQLNIPIKTLIVLPWLCIYIIQLIQFRSYLSDIGTVTQIDKHFCPLCQLARSSIQQWRHAWKPRKLIQNEFRFVASLLQHIRSRCPHFPAQLLGSTDPGHGIRRSHTMVRVWIPKDQSDGNVIPGLIKLASDQKLNSYCCFQAHPSHITSSLPGTSVPKDVQLTSYSCY
jgi:hypothetical protein